MSYTPENQLLEEPLLKAADALETLQAPLLERLRNPEEWNDSHLRECKEILDEVMSLELKLRRLQSEVR